MELFSRNGFSRTLCGVAFGSVFATSAAFLLLSSNLVEASDYSVDTIRITVPTSCTLNSTLDTAHTANMTPGQYKTDIGTTTFQVLCNDPGGFDVYAIGYSNDTYGTTTMINSSDSTIYFDTGTGQSGNSQWAMKLTPVSGTYAPTIQNGFNNYHVVPTTYTKVATFASNTDGTVGSKVQSTYAVYVSTSQIAGTYTGKVRYIIVHPQGAEAPLHPIACPSGYICYSPNASGVIDTMENQGISSSDTEIQLWASNFQRPGYGFAGWTDKFDWVLNANDASGNGTGDNAEYHIYGPNQTINFTAGQYSGLNPGLSLYAVWVPSAGNLQGWTGCSSLQIGKITALKDTRDNDTYAVAKLADGQCWMIENLRLADQALSGTTITLSTTNTHNPLNDGTNVTLTNVNSAGVTITNPATSNHLSASVAPNSNTPWCTATDTACLDKSMLYSGNTTSPVSEMTASNYTSNIYSYGNYYNWYSATAGKGTSNFSTNNDSVDGDLCPAGWRLPRGGSKARIESNDDNDFWNLIVDELNGGVKPAEYSNNGFPRYRNSAEASPVDKKIRSFPNNFIYSGYVSGSFIAPGNQGSYWSATASSSSVYRLFFYSTYVVPGTYYYDKYNGYSVRCVAGS